MKRKEESDSNSVEHVQGLQYSAFGAIADSASLQSTRFNLRSIRARNSLRGHYLWQTFSSSGSMKIEIRETTGSNGRALIEYCDGLENGLRTFFRPDGSKSAEAYFKDGERHGVSRAWFKNGQLAYEESYIQGVLNGVHRHWYESGSLQYESFFCNGKLDVCDYWYDMEGNLISQLKIIKGNRCGTTVELKDGAWGISTYELGEFVGFDAFGPEVKFVAPVDPFHPSH